MSKKTIKHEFFTLLLTQLLITEKKFFKYNSQIVIITIKKKSYHVFLVNLKQFLQMFLISDEKPL